MGVKQSPDYSDIPEEPPDHLIDFEETDMAAYPPDQPPSPQPPDYPDVPSYPLQRPHHHKHPNYPNVPPYPPKHPTSYQQPDYPNVPLYPSKQPPDYPSVPVYPPERPRYPQKPHYPNAPSYPPKRPPYPQQPDYPDVPPYPSKQPPDYPNVPVYPHKRPPSPQHPDYSDGPSYPTENPLTPKHPDIPDIPAYPPKQLPSPQHSDYSDIPSYPPKQPSSPHNQDYPDMPVYPPKRPQSSQHPDYHDVPPFTPKLSPSHPQADYPDVPAYPPKQPPNSQHPDYPDVPEYPHHQPQDLLQTEGMAHRPARVGFGMQKLQQYNSPNPNGYGPMGQGGALPGGGYPMKQHPGNGNMGHGGGPYPTPGVHNTPPYPENPHGNSNAGPPEYVHAAPNYPDERRGGPHQSHGYDILGQGDEHTGEHNPEAHHGTFNTGPENMYNPQYPGKYHGHGIDEPDSHADVDYPGHNNAYGMIKPHDEEYSDHDNHGPQRLLPPQYADQSPDYTDISGDYSDDSHPPYGETGESAGYTGQGPSSGMEQQGYYEGGPHFVGNYPYKQDELHPDFTAATIQPDNMNMKQPYPQVHVNSYPKQQVPYPTFIPIHTDKEDDGGMYDSFKHDRRKYGSTPKRPPLYEQAKHLDYPVPQQPSYSPDPQETVYHPNTYDPCPHKPNGEYEYGNPKEEFLASLDNFLEAYRQKYFDREDMELVLQHQFAGGKWNEEGPHHTALTGNPITGRKAYLPTLSPQPSHSQQQNILYPPVRLLPPQTTKTSLEFSQDPVLEGYMP